MFAWLFKHSCAVCKEKDQRIADLKAQLVHQNETLGGMINPVYTRAYNKAIDSEVNMALEGAGVPQIEVDEPAPGKPSKADIHNQMIQMLSATY
jgi:hypothetical protein